MPDELISLISGDDKAAYNELYERYWQKLFAIAYNRLQDVQASEDVVHEVFTGIWKNRAQLKINKAENYLAVATKYAVFRQIKKIQQARDYRNNLMPAISNSLENDLHYKMLLQLVRKEVEKLPERCRLVFNYSREAGMSVKEIASQMDISPKTVENQLTKALSHLRMAFRSFLH